MILKNLECMQMTVIHVITICLRYIQDVPLPKKNAISNGVFVVDVGSFLKKSSIVCLLMYVKSFSVIPE